MYTLPSLVTIISLIVYIGTCFNVSKARVKYDVKAPADSGNDDFLRYYRVQMNTLEQIVFFLPGLWLFAFYVSSVWASILGVVWIIGRIVYAKAYYEAANKRGPGFGLTFGASSILLLGSLIAVVIKLFS